MDACKPSVEIARALPAFTATNHGQEDPILWVDEAQIFKTNLPHARF